MANLKLASGRARGRPVRELRYGEKAALELYMRAAGSGSEDKTVVIRQSVSALITRSTATSLTPGWRPRVSRVGPAPRRSPGPDYIDGLCRTKRSLRPKSVSAGRKEAPGYVTQFKSYNPLRKILTC
ncbi:hypothetical protein EVAR_20870_1 [Eumeta japonica]|uniref:Uncharacterized protein n=1 Tax=Eumeta variegata TaxID=151549 RepID=A0A4C1UW07_EUMVA|nr:hypothetical protein EVAR_20870_1 [Eumeta japonica]